MADANFILSTEQMQEAAILYEEHEWPTSEIAEHFGVSKDAVKNSLIRMGVALRPSHRAAPLLRIKQCSYCLRFLPASMFSWTGSDKARKQSWCDSCTNQPREQALSINPAPLSQALMTWRS